ALSRPRPAGPGAVRPAGAAAAPARRRALRRLPFPGDGRCSRPGGDRGAGGRRRAGLNRPRRGAGAAQPEDRARAMSPERRTPMAVTESEQTTLDIGALLPAGKHLIAGEWVASRGGETFDVINPATG